MYEKIESCPICDTSQSENYLIITDHSFSQESFALVKCQKCSFIYTNPRPIEEESWKYYDSASYISHSNNTTSFKDLIYKAVRKYTLTQKTKLILKYKKQPIVLDYGCGSGHFLKHLIKQNIEAYGIEPAKEKSIDVHSSFNTKVYTSIKEFPKQVKPDIITAWHVIEHVHNLKETLNTLQKRLSENGYLIIALPNNQSLDATYYKEFWAGYDVPRHLYHFDKQSVKTLAKQLRMKVIKIYPMTFDAYYVSMLSEQYQRNKNSFFRGLKMGYQSNKSAKKTGEYSSLIYVLKK